MLAARHEAQIHGGRKRRADADALDGIGQRGTGAQVVRFLVDGDVDALSVIPCSLCWRAWREVRVLIRLRVR